MPTGDQQLVLSLIQGLAQRNGITIADTPITTFKALEDSIPLWTACLKSERYSVRTIEGYEQDIKRYLKQDPQPTLLSIQGYLAKRLDEVSATRVANERKALRSFFKFLAGADLIATDPTAKLKGFRVTYKERELPTEQDITKVLEAQCYRHSDTDKFRLMMTLLLDTGLRVGEGCTIRNENVNLEQLEVKVMGKGRKERCVPISPVTAKLLQIWLERNGHSEWLFSADNATGCWDERSFEKSLRRQCHRVGIKPFSPHALRHAFATWNLRNGARLEVISRTLGHASISVTADIYTHIDKEEIHDTHRKFSPFAKVMLPVSEA
jgi:integrase/recombinase XerD